MCEALLPRFQILVQGGILMFAKVDWAELHRHWRVEHADRTALLKERLRQCKEILFKVWKSQGLSSMAQLAETYVSVPGTERGRGILVAGDAKSGAIVYCNDRSVIIRSLHDPTKVEVYGKHGYPVTVARFSPNCEWIASGMSTGPSVFRPRNDDRTLRFEIGALSGSIDDLDWAPDGQRIVVCGDGKGSPFVN